MCFTTLTWTHLYSNVQYTLNINSHGYLAIPDGGAFDHVFARAGEFDQNVFEKSNSRGFARGGCQIAVGIDWYKLTIMCIVRVIFIRKTIC